MVLSYICLHPPRGNNLATGRPRLLDTFSSLGLCGCVTRETNLPDWRRVRVSVRLRRPSRLLARPRGAAEGPAAPAAARARALSLLKCICTKEFIYITKTSRRHSVSRGTVERRVCARTRLSEPPVQTDMRRDTACAVYYM